MSKGVDVGHDNGPEPDSIIVNELRCDFWLSLFIMLKMTWIHFCDWKFQSLCSYSCGLVVIQYAYDDC